MSVCFCLMYIILICVGYHNFVADLSKNISNRKFLKTNTGQSVSHYMLSCPLYQISVSSCELLNIIQTVLLISHWPERAVLLKSRHRLRYYMHEPVMWSETVGLTTRPVWDQRIGLGLGLVRSGLGLAGLMLCCETWSCYARRHNDFEGLINFSSTIYSFSILCLEHHYCGDQQWCLLT